MIIYFAKFDPNQPLKTTKHNFSQVYVFNVFTIGSSVLSFHRFSSQLGAGH